MTLQLQHPPRSAAGHSSDVRMWLHLPDRKVPVLQSSETLIKLADVSGVTASDAIVEVIVDGRSHRRNVRVISTAPDSQWVTIATR
jgi:hypothetical protein